MGAIYEKMPTKQEICFSGHFRFTKIIIFATSKKGEVAQLVRAHDS